MILMLLLGIALAETSPQGAGARPNILFIVTDDQSYRTISAYEGAYPGVRTPNIDALAAQGVRFRAAYLGTWCMPSRATLLTGKLPFAVESMRMAGPYPGSTYDPRRAPFWPNVFRRNGYVTAQIGKWHTGTDSGFGRDWDHQIVWNRPLHTRNAGNYYSDQLIERDGGRPQRQPGYATDNYTQWAVEFIEGKNRSPGKPWYLWLCYGAAHGPFTPANRHRGTYKDASIQPPADILGSRMGKPAYVRAQAVWERGPDGQPRLARRAASGDNFDTTDQHASYATAVRQYNETVLALDEGVGKVIAALKASGQLHNTLVMFTSDQGFAYGEHGFLAKLAPYDANIRSPLIISMPGRVAQGAVVNAPVSGADLVPTMFGFARIPLPWKMHGRDLGPLLKEPSRRWDRPVLMTHTGRRYGRDTAEVPVFEAETMQGVPWWVLLRDGRWKYIRTLVKDEIEELYDLEADPEELVNLALDPRHAKRVIRLRAASVAELRRLDAPFVDALPAVRPLRLELTSVRRK